MTEENLLNMHQHEFFKKILVLKKDFDFSVTSWFRTEKRNKQVGGKPTSKHLSGLAVDAVLDDLKDKERFLIKIRELGLHFLDEYASGKMHVHIQI